MKGPSDSRRSHGLKTRATEKPARQARAVDRFQLLLECADERDQRELYEHLTSRGRKCRVITI